MATESVTNQRLVASWYVTSSTHPDSPQANAGYSKCSTSTEDRPLLSSITRRTFGYQAYLPDLFRPLQTPSSNTASNPCSISRDLFPLGTGPPGYLPISFSGTPRLSSRLRSGHDSCSVDSSSTSPFYSLRTVLRGH